MLETSRLIRISPRAVIHGRNDWDQYVAVMSERKRVLGRDDHEKHRTYLFDDSMVNTVVVRASNHKLFVCRSVVKQWYVTGYVHTGLFISKTGSSFASTIKSVSESALIECNDAKEFWKDHFVVATGGGRNIKCIYCGAKVSKISSEHYECGRHRSYYGTPIFPRSEACQSSSVCSEVLRSEYFNKMDEDL